MQQLKNIDLLRSREVWESKLNEVNSVVNEEIGGRDIKFCSLWLKEINQELYRALEYQYRLGMESLNENLPEIKTDLCLRPDGTLEFNPSFDFLKAKYYGEIQRFIDYPRKCKVVGPGGDKSGAQLFKEMAGKNPQAIQTVYIKAEELFMQVQEIQCKYLEWTALGKLELSNHIRDNFKSVDDWAVNFSMIKQKRVELKRLEDSEKKDCIFVSLIEFKGGVERIFNNLSDILASTLKESVQDEKD